MKREKCKRIVIFTTFGKTRKLEILNNNTVCMEKAKNAYILRNENNGE